MVADSGRTLPPEMTRRPALSPFQDTRPCDHNFKSRKMLGGMEGPYMHSSDNAHSEHTRPPPLTIPQQPVSHHYSYIPTNTTNSSAHNTIQPGGGSSMFNLHAPAFQMPNTPSSSATSSPPFSPAPMQEPLHPPLNRSSSGPMISSYTQNHNTHRPYEPVKGEDDRYSSNHSHSHSPHHSGHYDSNPTTHTITDNQWNNTYDPRSTHHLHR